MFALSSVVRTPIATALRKTRPFSALAPFISPTAANDLHTSGKKVTFLDVRSPDDYSTGHILNATNCHSIFTYLATSDARGTEKLKSHFQNVFQEAGICGDEKVVTYEYSLNSLYGSSCRGYYLLKLLGHPNASILSGGLEGWIKHGYPTTTVVPKPVKGTFQAHWEPSVWSSEEDIAKAIEDKNAVLLDVRDLDEWEGKSSSPYGVDFTPRKGRLPGSVHILWKDFMKKEEDGVVCMKEQREILDMCAAKGITPDKKVIVYCFKGARAANTYVALREAGFKDVQNYFASWNEWSRNANLKIDSKVLN